MRIMPLMLAAALLLAACGEKAKTDTAEVVQETPAEPAAESTGDLKLQPGKWQASSELVSMEAEGLPPSIAQANIGQKNNFDSCITPEDAAKPGSGFFTNAQNTSCKPVSYAMTGGKLSAVMSCEDARSPGAMTLTVDGTYTPTSYAITSTMETTGGPTGGKMKVVAKTQGARVGECG